jgi:hypothetical protein
MPKKRPPAKTTTAEPAPQPPAEPVPQPPAERVCRPSFWDLDAKDPRPVANGVEEVLHRLERYRVVGAPFQYRALEYLVFDAWLQVREAARALERRLKALGPVGSMPAHGRPAKAIWALSEWRLTDRYGLFYELGRRQTLPDPGPIIAELSLYLAELRATGAAPLNGQAATSADQEGAEDEEADDIQVVPGGFLLWGKIRGQLTGKPWDVLRVLHCAPGRCLARSMIFKAAWEEGSTTDPEQAVRDTVCAIRKALQKACNKARVQLPRKHDFVVGRGRGEHRVYEFNLPARESIGEK